MDFLSNSFTWHWCSEPRFAFCLSPLLIFIFLTKDLVKAPASDVRLDSKFTTNTFTRRPISSAIWLTSKIYYIICHHNFVWDILVLGFSTRSKSVFGNLNLAQESCQDNYLQLPSGVARVAPWTNHCLVPSLFLIHPNRQFKYVKEKVVKTIICSFSSCTFWTNHCLVFLTHPNPSSDKVLWQSLRMRMAFINLIHRHPWSRLTLVYYSDMGAQKVQMCKIESSNV